MKRIALLGAWILSVTYGGLLAHSADAANGEVEQRINRVINGVLVQDKLRYYELKAVPLKDRMASYHTPGVSIAVINHSQLEWARGFGLTEWGATNPVTETTLFQAASISKPIFAMAVMRLVQEGKLNLDEDVDHYLKSWKVPANASGLPKVTLRQILGHTAGFTVHGFAGYDRSDKIPTLIEILRGRPPAKNSPVVVNLKPGSEFRYSGGGTTVAQMVVTDVAGQPFPKIMQDLVLGPLGMEHSTYDQPLPAQWHKSAASAYTTKYNAVAGSWHVYPMAAPAGLWTTPSDLAKAGIDFQRALDGMTNTVLRSEAVREMLKPGLGNVGIGFFVSGAGRSERFSHGGANDGFRSDMTFYEQGGFGAVIMVNSDEGGPLMTEIERAIAREYDWPDFLPTKRQKVAINSRCYDGLTGQYFTDSLPICIVHRDGDRLMAHLFGQRDAQIYPESETNFFFNVVDAQLSFVHNKSGKIDGLVLHQNGDLAFRKFSDDVPEAAGPVNAADCAPRSDSLLQGCWKGSLGHGSNTLHLIVRIAEPVNGKFRAELDSVDQKADHQALSVIYQSPQVKLVVMAGHGMFEGEISRTDTKMTGKWIQGENSIPVTFERFDPDKDAADRSATPARPL